MKSVVLAAAAAALVAPAANAQIDSVRLGVMKHNICVADCKNADKESGANINRRAALRLAGLARLGGRRRIPI